MNPLRDGARGRRKSDIGQIRHVYLDFDKNGAAAIDGLKEQEDMPTPNHILESSPRKYQVVWRVDQFERDESESLMRGMVRELGADPPQPTHPAFFASPDFITTNYERPHFVTVQNLSDETTGFALSGLPNQ